MASKFFAFFSIFMVLTACGVKGDLTRPGEKTASISISHF